MIIGINAKKLYAAILISAVLVAVLYLFCNADSGKESFPVTNSVTNNTILVIDAGHGGEDGGAQSEEGLLESGINLDIALRIEALCGLIGVDTVMTRDSEDIEYPDTASTTSARKRYDQKRRVELVNSVENAVLISIHQNKFPDPQPRGSQVLYSASENSKLLGELMHENLVTLLYPENRRVAAPISESIYLMKAVSCPAVLVECAFLSNPAEAELLKTDEYKTSLAVVILGSYLQYDKGLI